MLAPRTRSEATWLPRSGALPESIVTWHCWPGRKGMSRRTAPPVQTTADTAVLRALSSVFCWLTGTGAWASLQPQASAGGANIADFPMLWVVNKLIFCLTSTGQGYLSHQLSLIKKSSSNTFLQGKNVLQHFCLFLLL